MIFNVLLTHPDDTVLCSIPTYPLYSAALSLYGGSLAPYYLNE